MISAAYYNVKLYMISVTHCNVKLYRISAAYCNVKLYRISTAYCNVKLCMKSAAYCNVKLYRISATFCTLRLHMISAKHPNYMVAHDVSSILHCEAVFDFSKSADEREWVRDIWNQWFDEVFPPTPVDSEDDFEDDATQTDAHTAISSDMPSKDDKKKT